MPPSDRELDALLAKGNLAGPEADRILERVLVRHARPARGRWWLTLTAGLSLAAAAAGVLLFVGPFRSSGFTARGGGGAGPAVEVACLGGSLTACPRGATLMFASRESSPGGYLAAWAEPVGGGERVWYFSADQETPRLAAGGTGTQPLLRGARIGDEHRPGRYRVHVVLSEQPLSRTALAAAPPVLAHDEVELTVIDGAAP